MAKSSKGDASDKDILDVILAKQEASKFKEISFKEVST